MAWRARTGRCGARRVRSPATASCRCRRRWWIAVHGPGAHRRRREPSDRALGTGRAGFGADESGRIDHRRDARRQLEDQPHGGALYLPARRRNAVPLHATCKDSRGRRCTGRGKTSGLGAPGCTQSTAYHGLKLVRSRPGSPLDGHEIAQSGSFETTPHKAPQGQKFRGILRGVSRVPPARARHAEMGQAWRTAGRLEARPCAVLPLSEELHISDLMQMQFPEGSLNLLLVTRFFVAFRRPIKVEYTIPTICHASMVRSRQP